MLIHKVSFWHEHLLIFLTNPSIRPLNDFSMRYYIVNIIKIFYKVNLFFCADSARS